MTAPAPASPWTRFASPQALEAFGAKVAPLLERGEAVCLFGPLGAGKTTFARGLIRALNGADTEAPSPTFTLMQVYEGGRFPLAHFDLYRLKRPEEAFEIGLDEALDIGAAVVEWSERLGADLPPDRLEVRLEATGEGPQEHRRARVQGEGSWLKKVQTLVG